MPTAIETLKQILAEKQPIPDGKMEKWNFVGKYFALKFKEYLSPDSQHYRSPLNPIFSYEFEIDEKHFLSQVKLFSLRDGVLSLMRFFALNPEPIPHCPLLIIDSSLSSLVPESWKTKVVLRTAYFTKEKAAVQKLVLALSPDPLNLPLELLRKEISSLKKSLPEKTEFSILFSSMRMRGQGEAICDKAWSLKFLMAITEELQGRPLQVISFQDFLQMDLSDTHFECLNPLRYYFTDSFLLHNASQRGAIHLRKQTLASDHFHLNLSLHHGFFFHQDFDPYIGKEYDEVKARLFHSLKDYATTKQFMLSGSSLYPKDFMDWSRDVAIGLYQQRLSQSPLK